MLPNPSSPPTPPQKRSFEPVKNGQELLIGKKYSIEISYYV